MPKKILITGGAGYLGSIMVPMLLEQGFDITVVDNFMYNQASLNHVCYSKNLEIIRGDVRDYSLMKRLISSNDAIIPLAAYVGAPLCKLDPVGAHSVNHDAIINMLELVSREQIILMPTTNSAYGSGDSNNFCTEKSELKPISKYAIDKVEIEKKLMQRDNSVSLRLATVFGMSPRMRLDLLVNDFTYRAVNDKFIVLFEGHFKRNYIHIRDISRVFLHCIRNFSEMKGEIYNVGLSNANISKAELCSILKEMVPEFYYVEADVGTDPDQRNYIVSNDKIERTGFKAEVDLKLGISELLKGYQMIKNRIYGNV